MYVMRMPLLSSTPLLCIVPSSKDLITLIGGENVCDFGKRVGSREPGFENVVGHVMRNVYTSFSKLTL